MAILHSRLLAACDYAEDVVLFRSTWVQQDCRTYKNGLISPSRVFWLSQSCTTIRDLRIGSSRFCFEVSPSQSNTSDDTEPLGGLIRKIFLRDEACPAQSNPASKFSSLDVPRLELSSSESVSVPITSRSSSAPKPPRSL